MDTSSILLFLGLIGLAAMAGLALKRWWRLRKARQLQRARQVFHRRREWLEAEFLKRAGNSGKPRGLTWVDCDFADAVTFARDRSNGQLKALVGVAIRFEAQPGGGMEHVSAVSNLRLATAVFHFVDGSWQSEGRAIFNLDPSETIRHFQHELEQA